MTELGGAFVGGLVGGSDELPILAFMRASQVLSTLALLPDLRAEGALPFADCSLGNLCVLRRDGAVYALDPTAKARRRRQPVGVSTSPVAGSTP